ncbi:hypothetical protein [Roseisolibacter agri]|uniref:hypothetical protein n=1 Tax=Roseisolibacter agri TaxID=2014610 RepID=UPI0024E11D66|nr:hypothetical protein [Roseisolibacter agri]
MTSLSEFVAAALHARAPQLAVHWQTRAVAATPRQDAPAGAVASGPEAVVRALAAGLTKDAWPAGEVMRLGWSSGVAAHGAGLAIPHVQRDADLLLAVLLAEAERVVADAPADVAATPAAALALARRLQRLAAGHAQAAVAGFLHAQRESLRTRWRTLRHDLRNPIGTIQSALALMDDEALPVESRQHPRMRAMVARNAGTLAQLITDGLDDRAAASVLAAQQAVSLRALADAARREVRDAARDAGCEVDVAHVPDEPPTTVEPATIELALTVLMLAGLAQARRGDVLRVDRPSPAAGRASSGAPVLRIARLPADAPESAPDADDGAPRWDAAGVTLAAALLAAAGGRLTTGAPGLSRADDAAALDDAPALHLLLPDLAADDGGAA